MPARLPRRLAAAGHQAPSADNSQPWRFVWDGRALGVCYDAPRVVGHTFPADDPATLLAMGGVLENIDQVAMALGLDLDWTPLEIDHDVACYGRTSIDPLAGDLARAAQLPLFDRHTNRLAYRPDPLPGEIVEFLDDADGGEIRVRLYRDRAALVAVRTLVGRALRIRFRTQEVHEWLAESLRFTPEEVARGDGLDVATLDLPPGGALFMRYIKDWNHMRQLNRLGAYRLMAAIDARPVAHGPAVLAITGPGALSQGLNAGRLLTRIWNRLNNKGIAVHPYYVISDQLQRLAAGRVPEPLCDQARALARDCASFFGLEGGERLYMLLRLGWPHHRPPRSRRLPLEAVFEDRS